MITLEQAVDTVMQLPPQQQEMLIDIISYRRIEERRKQIAKDARESLAAFRAGKLTPQPVQDILRSLNNGIHDEMYWLVSMMLQWLYKSKAYSFLDY